MRRSRHKHGPITECFYGWERESLCDPLTSGNESLHYEKMHMLQKGNVSCPDTIFIVSKDSTWRKTLGVPP